MNNLITGIVYCSIFFSFLLCVELARRNYGWKPENTRRILHLLSGSFALLMSSVLKPWVFVLMTLCFFTVISISFFSSYFSAIHKVKRKTIGELLFPIGILLAYFSAQGYNAYFVSALLILTFADPLASWVGMNYKKNKYAGSVAFFACTLVILITSFSVSNLFFLSIIAILLTVIERHSPYGTDNATLPLSTVLLLKLFL